jgi:elongation factor P
MRVSDMRPGVGFNMDGKLCVVVGIEHRTPGNLRAFVQLTYREVMSGKQLDKRMQPTEDLQVVELDRRSMEFLFTDNSGSTFMDLENYEQHVLNKALLGDTIYYLRPNSEVIVLCNDGNPIRVELPAAVELTVTDTPPRHQERHRDQPVEGSDLRDRSQDQGPGLHRDRREDQDLYR